MIEWLNNHLPSSPLWQVRLGGLIGLTILIAIYAGGRFLFNALTKGSPKSIGDQELVGVIVSDLASREEAQ